ncbi:MAG: glycosyltransferase, partial [Gemmatimonadaceae bacterium]|nr:glycosyltransferase [Gemmatimonadaceae bacterium]
MTVAASVVATPVPRHVARDAASLRVAIVHDWLVTWAGAERCLERFLALFPQADLFATIDHLPAPLRAGLHGKRARTSFLQPLPGVASWYRKALPVMPAAIASLDLTGYDLVLSSSHAVAKGVPIPRGAHHVCYCYTPMRYAWDLRDEYLDALGWGGVRRLAAGWLLDRLRAWDLRSARRVDAFIAISHEVAGRIGRNYGRDATVIHPPVNVDAFTPGVASRGTHFVTAGRLVPYKRVDLMCDAFRMRPDRELRVIGDGPEGDRLRRAAPPNVRFLGRVDESTLLAELRSARAFVFAAEEDFGIAPLEAQACGTPVLAYARGAVRETLRPLGAHEAPGAVFYEAQSPDALCEAIATLDARGDAITADACRTNAMRFATARFDAELRDFFRGVG